MRTFFSRVAVFFSCLFVCLVVNAGNNPNDSIRFRPQPGQRLEYALQMQMDIQAKASYGLQKASLFSTALMSYTVQSVSESSAQILMKPEFLELSSEGLGGMDFSIQEISDSDVRSALIRDGFIFDVDLNSGKVLSMRAVNQQAWKEMVSDADEQKLKELLEQQFAFPVVPQSIPAQEGASLVLENFQGFKNVSLTVDKILGDQVQLTLTAQGGQNAFVRMIVNRQTGWPVECTLLTQVPIVERGSQTSVQTVLFMKEGRESFAKGPISQIQSLKMISNRVFDPGISNQPQPGKTDLKQNDVFPQATGLFRMHRKGLSLFYINNLERNLESGVFKLEQLSLLDNQGKTIPIHLLDVGSSLLDYLVLADYLVFKETDGEKIQASLAQVKARLAYYPEQVERLTLPVLAGKPTQMKTERVLIELKPTDRPTSYHLSYTLPVNSWLNMHYIPGAGQGTTIEPAVPPEESLPWLSSKFASLVGFTTLGSQRTYDYQLNFETVPEQLTFYIGHPADQAVYYQDIVFIDEASYKKNIQLPPETESVSHIMDVAQEDIEQLAPQGGGKIHDLRFYLPLLQAPNCQLKLVDGPLINGEPLKWTKSEQKWDYQNDLWQLSTTDQIIYYFYGVTVKTELMCSGKFSWEDIAYERYAKQPWLLNLSQLPGYVLDVKQPVRMLYDDFRFLNVQEEVLLPRQVNYSEQWINEEELLNLPLNEFLVDGHYLLMAGVPTKIKQKKYHEDSLRKEWVTHFDPIVCEPGDLACPE